MLRAGVIIKAPFLDLNEKVGGYDQDANDVAGRSVGSAAAIQRAYPSGLQYGPLGQVPAMDGSDRRRHRRRDGARQGGPQPADHRRLQQPRGRVRGRTADLRQPADPICNTLLPSYGALQLTADGPLSASILKCQLKPVTAADHGSVAFTLAEATRLNKIFPNGVCDWKKPGIGQVPVAPYASFGPGNLLFDVAKSPRQAGRTARCRREPRASALGVAVSDVRHGGPEGVAALRTGRCGRSAGRRVRARATPVTPPGVSRR